MLCPNCFNGTHKVIDVTKLEDCTQRRCECKFCSYRWNTIEIDADLYQSILESRRNNNVYTENTK